MRLDEDSIYATRGGTEIGLVRFRLITGGRRFNILVEYQPANPTFTYAEPQTELVDWRGYVFGAEEPHARDLIRFIEHAKEPYYQ